MSDIADKIYAATGLTLNAEAAAAIERLIQAENEKLRAALQEIRNKARTGRPPFMSSKTDFFQIASKALGEKE